MDADKDEEEWAIFHTETRKVMELDRTVAWPGNFLSMVDTQQWNPHVFIASLREVAPETNLDVRKKNILVLNEIYKENSGQ